MPSQNVLFVTWTWPSMRMRLLFFAGVAGPHRASPAEEACASERAESDVPTAASAPAPNVRSASRRVHFELLIGKPFAGAGSLRSSSSPSDVAAARGRFSRLARVERREEQVPSCAEVIAGGRLRRPSPRPLVLRSPARGSATRDAL